MENQLPTQFDLIVIGTGLVESVVSAAASRIGKTVLHIDRNDYYGAQWASFSLKTLHNFTPSELSAQDSSEGCMPLGNDIFHVQNLISQFHVPEKEEISLSNDIEDVKEEKEEIKEVTQQVLLSNSRKFNIDLVPKLHFARGEFVQLLITSNIARYAEYRSVSRVLTYLNGQLEVVPCSRSDVFATDRISVIEKRMLMKLLTSLNDSDSLVTDTPGVTFKQFLIEKKLPENLIHFILYAMSGSTEDTPVAEGICRTKRFLNSLGRFGKTPFLFSMYGSGETTQAFCRLSAVFGGVFALNQDRIRGFSLENNSVKELVNAEQKITAEHFVINAELAPKQFVANCQITQYIARAVLITNQSIMSSELEHLTLLTYPPEGEKNIVTILEMGSLTGTCPKGYFLVHLTAKQVDNPQDDFKHIIGKLFGGNNQPNILWSCYFSLPLINLEGSESPNNVFICDGPDLDLDYDTAVAKAKTMFLSIYPDLEFLPRAPDPEEIIIGDETSAEL